MSQILVIEDEQDIRENLLKILQYEGYSVLGAENGRVGVQLARLHIPDLIICDIMMPELNGYGVLVSLRKDPRTAMIPFIFLTARTAKADFRKGIQFGADAYLPKPVDLDALLREVNAITLRQETEISQQLGLLRYHVARTLPHALQMPLTGIVGFAGVLAELGLEAFPGSQEILEIQTYIYDNALRLQHLMSDYLLYAELQLLKAEPARQQHWQRTLVFTHDVIAGHVRKQADTAGRTSDVFLDLVEADLQLFPGILQKIVDELVERALLVSEAGTRINVTTTYDGTQVTLRISDEGQKIPEASWKNLESAALLEQPFDVHQQIWLGLQICRLLAELHGGSLAIEGNTEKGTTVTVVLT